MSWNKRIKQEARRNRFLGGVILSLVVFLALSFVSYSPQDPSLNSFGLSLKVNNYCGFVGAVLADLFFQVFGLSSWLFLLGALGLAYKLLRNRWQESILSSSFSFSLLALSLASLSELHFPSMAFFNGEVSLGGGLGIVIISSLTPFFDTAGTAVVLWSAFFLLFLFYGQMFFSKVPAFPLKKFFIQILLGIKKTPALFLIIVKNAGKFNRRFWQSSRKLLVFSFQKIKTLVKLLFKKKFPKSSREAEKDFQKSIKEPAPLGKFSFKKESSNKKPLFVFNERSLSLKEKSKSALDDSSKKDGSLDNSAFSQKDELKSQTESSPLLEENLTSSIEQKITPTFKELPSLETLSDSPSSQKINRQDVEDLSKKLLDKLSQFSIQGEIKAVKTGPAVALFEFKPEDHIKVSRIKEMENDLSLALSSESVRIIAPIPGKDVVGIEASRPYREMVYLKNLLKEEGFFKADLPLILGRRADNQIGLKDLARIPHLLVAGTTGSGKSMFIISFITSLLFRHSPETLRLILIDPKQVDLSCFKDIPHLLSPIITSGEKSSGALLWACREMEKRYRSFALFEARDHKSFNEKIKKLSAKEKKQHEERNKEAPETESYYFEPLPLICLVIEEFGDLMADRNIRRAIENSVVRLAQKARASGMHLVLAMQSPRKDVVTGLIKTNIPGRISFKVASGTDSRIILDEVGAEKLLPHGDMLFLEPGSPKPSRYHGPFIRDRDVRETAKYWRNQGEPLYEEALTQGTNNNSSKDFSSFADDFDITSDPMYDEICGFVKTCKVISASFLQRKFRIGYPRAARMIEALHEQGQIGPPQGSKPREVLLNK